MILTVLMLAAVCVLVSVAVSQVGYYHAGIFFGCVLALCASLFLLTRLAFSLFEAKSQRPARREPPTSRESPRRVAPLPYNTETVPKAEADPGERRKTERAHTSPRVAHPAGKDGTKRPVEENILPDFMLDITEETPPSTTPPPTHEPEMPSCPPAGVPKKKYTVQNSGLIRTSGFGVELRQNANGIVEGYCIDKTVLLFLGSVSMTGNDLLVQGISQVFDFCDENNNRLKQLPQGALVLQTCTPAKAEVLDPFTVVLKSKGIVRVMKKQY